MAGRQRMSEGMRNVVVFTTKGTKTTKTTKAHMIWETASPRRSVLKYRLHYGGEQNS
jgi:hypothetical protein